MITTVYMNRQTDIVESTHKVIINVGYLISLWMLQSGLRALTHNTLCNYMVCDIKRLPNCSIIGNLWSKYWVYADIFLQCFCSSLWRWIGRQWMDGQRDWQTFFLVTEWMDGWLDGWLVFNMLLGCIRSNVAINIAYVVPLSQLLLL